MKNKYFSVKNTPLGKKYISTSVTPVGPMAAIELG